MDIALLHIVLWAPLVGALLTMMFGQGMRARVVALLSTGFTLAAAAWLYVRYDLRTGGTQFESVAPFIPQIGSYLRIGVDGVSLPLVFLNCFLSFLVVLISWKFELRPQLYFVLVQFLQTAVTGVFVSLDLFVFFLFWELELAPMFLLIGIWGGAAPRVRGDEVHHLHDRRHRLHAGRHPGAVLHDRRRHVRPVPDQRRREGAAGGDAGAACSCCCSSGSR